MDYQRTYHFKKIIYIIILCGILSACASTNDITNDSVLRGNYRKGIVLISKQEILLNKHNYLWAHKPDIEKVKEYGLTENYKGMLEKGTKIEIIRIELYQHPENGNYVYPIGQLLTGKWKGEEVNLYYVSASSNSPANDSYYVDIKDIDTEMFEIVSEEK
jgi:hypothetical protein